MPRLCLDDLMRISIGDLKVRPHDYRKDVALVERPVPAAVAFELNTHSEPPFVVLSCGRTRTVVRLLAEPGNLGGLRWHFLDQSNRRALKMYWLEDVGFFSRGDLAERGIHPRVRYLSNKNRMRLSRERTVQKLKDLRVRWGVIARKEQLEGKLEHLRRRLAGEESRV